MIQLVVVVGPGAPQTQLCAHDLPKLLQRLGFLQNALYYNFVIGETHHLNGAPSPALEGPPESRRQHKPVMIEGQYRFAEIRRGVGNETNEPRPCLDFVTTKQ